MKIFTLILLFILIFVPLAFSHEGEIPEEERLDDKLKSNSVFYVYIASAIVALFVVFSVYAAKRPYFNNKKKMILFLGIVLPVILASFYLISTTIYINAVSQTKGPVHWHADFEIYACGNKLDLIDPTGISNRIGTSVFHEHGDDRIHVEGVVVVEEDIGLHHFFDVIGGSLSSNSITLPIEDEVLTFENGDLCNDVPGKLQVFLYKTEDKIVSQEKLVDFEDYILSPESLPPPGDCIIIEFDQDKAETSHICETYRIALDKGELSGG